MSQITITFLSSSAFYGDSDLEDADGTLARLTPVTGLATIEGLDQDSIVLEDQVNSVVSALNSWFETSGHRRPRFGNTCADLRDEDADDSGYTVKRCKVKIE
jgi:hypothetical protein